MRPKTSQSPSQQLGLKNKVTNLQGLCMVAFMAALIGAGAYIFVPLGPVPITFQELFVILAGLTLGPVKGPVAVLLYILAGSLGLPVFSGGRSGIGHLLSPTGGYIAGYIFLAFFSGLGGKIGAKFLRSTLSVEVPQKVAGEVLADTKSTASTEMVSLFSAKRPKVFPVKERLLSIVVALLLVILGLAFLYGMGGLWLAHSLQKTFTEAIAIGVLPFLPFAMSKSLLAVLIWQKLLARGVIVCDR